MSPYLSQLEFSLHPASRGSSAWSGGRSVYSAAVMKLAMTLPCTVSRSVHAHYSRTHFRTMDHTGVTEFEASLHIHCMSWATSPPSRTKRRIAYCRLLSWLHPRCEAAVTGEHTAEQPCSYWSRHRALVAVRSSLGCIDPDVDAGPMQRSALTR